MYVCVCVCVSTVLARRRWVCVFIPCWLGEGGCVYREYIILVYYLWCVCVCARVCTVCVCVCAVYVCVCVSAVYTVGKEKVCVCAYIVCMCVCFCCVG